MKKMKLAFAAVGFVISGFANATVVTVSMSGMIDSGNDTIGLFGTPGRNLANLPYAVTVTFGIDNPTTLHKYANSSYVATQEPFVAVVIIDGVRYANFVDHDQSILSMRLPVTGFNANPGISFSTVGRDTAGTLVSVHGSVSQDIFTTSLTDYLNVPLQGTAAFTLQIATSKLGEILKDSNPSTFVLNGDPATLTPPAPLVPDPAPSSGTTPVPEPTSVMLFGAGLLGFAALRRRQSRY